MALGRQTLPVPQRYFDRILVDESGCLLWLGRKDPDGYGMCKVEGREKRIHRVIYAPIVGPIPEGLTLAHLCKTRSCVNPRHLEPLSSGENSLRGDGPTAINARKTHCKRGHRFDKDNTYKIPGGGRSCRSCQKAAHQRFKERARV